MPGFYLAFALAHVIPKTMDIGAGSGSRSLRIGRGRIERNAIVCAEVAEL